MNNKETTQRTYEEGAQMLAQKFTAIGSRENDIQRAFHAIAGRQHPFVLEVGCGNGRDAAVILQYDCEYVGIDYSRKMIALAKEDNPNATFLVADMEEYTPEHRVDILFAFASLLHLPPEHFQNFLQRIVKYVASSGVVYISVKEGSGEHLKHDIFGERYFYYYTIEDIARMSDIAGFTVEYTEGNEILGVRWITVMLRKGREEVKRNKASG